MTVLSNTNKMKRSHLRLKAINVTPPISGFSAPYGLPVSGVVYVSGVVMQEM
jgi:hypothetical protein